ncbi:uncharacterized protein LOC127739007 [Mytilus californianus]|uniref:uncharacterized protein LOC127739007 n=1 Tax=Mytilus californianus TaxID=6549 RepID=UPI002248230B|nr:uncharacterized protein LOC127739007 [Mytilus californianus]
MATSTVLNENYITNYARLGHAAQELLPEVLRELLLIKEPPTMLFKDCKANKYFADRVLRLVEWQRITNVATDGYSKFDIQLSYKIIRNLNLVTCPTRGWDHPQDPMVHELTIGDDVERIRRQRNEILHKGETKVTDKDLAEYFSVFKGLAIRLENYLGKPQGHFLSKFEQLETRCMDQKSEEQFIQTIKNLVKNEEDIKDEVGRVRIEVEQLKIKGNSISKLEEENKCLAERFAKVEEMLLSLLKHNKDTMPIDLFEPYLVEWQEEEKDFVLTRAAQYVLDAIVTDSCKCIVVTGCPGSGKSAIIHHVVIFLQKTMAYEIIPIVCEPGDFKQYFSSSRRQVFVLDNTFGTIAVNARLVESWYANLEVIEKMLNIGNTKVLLSCRMQIMNDSHLQRLKLFTSNECNLHTEKMFLLEKERMMIAERYLNISEIKEISDIMNLYEFFPLLCKWYAKNKKTSIRDFFQNPVDIFKQNIVEMKEDPNKIQYCAFVLCLLYNGRLHEKWFEIGSENESTLQSICGEFGIDFRIKRKNLQQQLDRLENTYIKKVNRNYYIVHDKVYDVAVVICGQDLIECFIEYTDSTFIGDRYQLESTETDFDETVIIIPKQHEDRYFQRILKDLVEYGHIYSSFQNRQLQNQQYRDKLMAFMRSNKCIIRNILQKMDELQLRLIESRQQQTEDIISLSAEEGDHSSSGEDSDHPSSGEDIDHSSSGEDCDHTLFGENTESDNTEVQRPRRNKQNTNQICPTDDKDFPLPLLESSVQGHEDIVKLLINFGCNVNVFDKFRRTALFLAASHGHRSTVETLLQSNCNSSLCDVWERSPFYVACQEGHSDIVKLLLKVSDISKSDTCYFKTPLHVACEFGHFMIVKMLLENGSSIYQCNTDGHSPLFVACERGHTQLVQLLLAHGADINQRDEKDKTPLFIACENGYSEVVKILLDHKANISLCNSDGLSPIHVACKWGHTNTVTILIERNADINRLDRLYGRTPLFLAVEGQYSEIIELLVENGCVMFFLLIILNGLL